MGVPASPRPGPGLIGAKARRKMVGVDTERVLRARALSAELARDPRGAPLLRAESPGGERRCDCSGRYAWRGTGSRAEARQRGGLRPTGAARAEEARPPAERHGVRGGEGRGREGEELGQYRREVRQPRPE